MESIQFDINKLNKTDLSIYEQMLETEQASFQRTWVAMETYKAKLAEKKNAAKIRVARNKREASEKERKNRTHRLCERGAILESVIPEPLDFSNEDIKRILQKAFRSDNLNKYIEKIRRRNIDEKKDETKNGD